MLAEIGIVSGFIATIVGGLALYQKHKSQKDSKRQIDFLDVKMSTRPIHDS